MEHLTVQANGAAFHVARAGQGRPLLLLHGWPEFWLTWEPVMTRLADRFTLYAPDLRGFGDSDKPDGPFGPDQQASDMLALMDALGIKQAGIVGHDVGGALMQPLARQAPGAHRRAVLLRLRLSRHRAADGGAGAAQQHLVPVVPSDGDGPAAGRRDARDLPRLYRAFSQRLVASQGCVRRRAGSLHRQFHESRQSRRRLCALPRRACGPHQDDEGRSARPAADLSADLHPLGRARSAVSLRLDRSA